MPLAMAESTKTEITPQEAANEIDVPTAATTKAKIWPALRVDSSNWLLRSLRPLIPWVSWLFATIPRPLSGDALKWAGTTRVLVLALDDRARATVRHMGWRRRFSLSPWAESSGPTLRAVLDLDWTFPWKGLAWMVHEHRLLGGHICVSSASATGDAVVVLPSAPVRGPRLLAALLVHPTEPNVDITSALIRRWPSFWAVDPPTIDQLVSSALADVRHSPAHVHDLDRKLMIVRADMSELMVEVSHTLVSPCMVHVEKVECALTPSAPREEAMTPT